MRDWRLTVSARRALDQDEALSPLNLGVSVRNGVAVLWGTVPSVALAARAAEMVRSVPGLDDVQSELHLVRSDDTKPITPEPRGQPAPTALTGRPEAPPTRRSSGVSLLAPVFAPTTPPAPPRPGVILLPPPSSGGDGSDRERR